jgi:hypothetical protein
MASNGSWGETAAAGYPALAFEFMATPATQHEHTKTYNDFGGQILSISKQEP